MKINILFVLVFFNSVAFAQLSLPDILKGNYNDPLQGSSVQSSSFSIFAMECQDKITLLDYYELYETESNYRYEVEQTSRKEIIDELIIRMARISKPRADLFKFWRHHFEEEVKFVRNVNFGPTEDEFDFIVREGCEIKTLLKALNPTEAGKGIFVELNLWEKLDVQSQAGAILNYLINLDYIFLQDYALTVYSRYLNAFLASNRASSITNLRKRSKFLKSLGFKYIYQDGVFFELIQYYGDPQIFKVDTNNEIIKATSMLVPFELRHLNYLNKIEIKNVPGMTIGGPTLHTFNIKKGRELSIKDVYITSPCIGKYSVPKFTNLETVNLVYSKGKFYFKSLFTIELLRNGEDLCRIEYDDGELLLIENDCNYGGSSSHAQELVLCDE